MSPSNLLRNQKSSCKQYLIGVDEVGRGPWAGPVVACACALQKDSLFLQKHVHLLKDSKKCSQKQREKVNELLKESAKSEEVIFVIQDICAQEVDVLGIKKATKKAMQLCLEQLQKKLKNHNILSIKIDGNDKFIFEKIAVLPSFHIKGDSKFSEIQAASILAKVSRDTYMSQTVENAYPQYGFAKHKGYGTALHREMLQKHGACAEHRFSFRPIKMLENKAKMNNMEKI